MKRFQDLLNRLNRQVDVAYASIRVYLGVALFIRGFIMLYDPSAITSIAGAHEYYMWYSYIIVGHLAGGALLAMGYQTRLAALSQLPILVGAVFFVHLRQGLLMAGQSLELASLVLFLLAVYAVFGSGSWSVDRFVSARKSGAPAMNA